jgi:hypothetical protein
MEDNYEKVVRWYLRFNGYLTAENFVIHEARNGQIPQGGEFDTIGVRFPHSREQVDQKLIRTIRTKLKFTERSTSKKSELARGNGPFLFCDTTGRSERILRLPSAPLNI